VDATVEALYEAVLDRPPRCGRIPMRCDGLSTGIEVAAAELGTIVAAQRARRPLHDPFQGPCNLPRADPGIDFGGQAFEVN
jgi:hypothetical protein